MKKIELYIRENRIESDTTAQWIIVNDEFKYYYTYQSGYWKVYDSNKQVSNITAYNIRTTPSIKFERTLTEEDLMLMLL